MAVKGCNQLNFQIKFSLHFVLHSCYKKIISIVFMHNYIIFLLSPLSPQHQLARHGGHKWLILVGGEGLINPRVPHLFSGDILCSPNHLIKTTDWTIFYYPIVQQLFSNILVEHLIWTGGRAELETGLNPGITTYLRRRNNGGKFDFFRW